MQWLHAQLQMKDLGVCFHVCIDKNILRFVEMFLAYLNAQYVGVKASLFGYFKRTCLHLPVPVHETAYPLTKSTKLHKKNLKTESSLQPTVYQLVRLLKSSLQSQRCDNITTGRTGWECFWNSIYLWRKIYTIFCLRPGFQTVNWVLGLKKKCFSVLTKIWQWDCLLSGGIFHTSSFEIKDFTPPCLSHRAQLSPRCPV